ncbi:glycoside hydrolase family 61 protein [Phanerochaete carnosa HHB-10118-sp]|uniref:AA9 family lytic polysaccharide monooxygenase n=1 Tax=Phanerochaete carnosa (strain HHB-10118-sp) TaxID=650164 RepID=K5VXP2_PHACS|nr:glycoside hydrolase family 61 protein [Phanerochaete carnosa HHB-10118-sp]EKM56323.1 glycoside hydrolase family 61 protein [Phanerochaete carnosa HHB-10118-sp]
MFAFAALVALASSALPTVFAHGGVLAYSNAGNWYQGWAPYNSPDGQTSIERPWSTYNPITDPTDPTLSCNDDGTSSALQLTATVAAGSAITAYWNSPWPHAIGPMLTYLAQCPGSTCTGVNSDSLQWFKIDEAGLLSGTVFSGSWADGQMIADNSSWTTTIPSTVPSGNYLIRFETIALHSLPAQFYPECAQIQITGGGNQAPTTDELVTFPGAYSSTDPGLDIDVYSNAAQTETTYIIPGPPLYGSGTGAPAPPPSSTPTVSVPASSPSSTPTSAPTGPTVAQYGQCGGQGYTGATICASGSTCTVVNPYYSQCL